MAATVTFPYRFGRCTTSTFGSVAIDMIDLPRVQSGYQPADTPIGSATRYLDGTMRVDRRALKREWSSLPCGTSLSRAQWWPVKRIYLASAVGMFYDQAIPNAMSGDQCLMQNSSWTNAAGTALVPRGTYTGVADGALSLAIGGVAQLGPTTSPTRTLLVPVVAAQQYFAGCTVVGPGAWAVTVAIGWYDAAGSAALSTSTVASGVTAATALSTCLVLDGSVTGYRVGGAATAPAGALYAQVRISTATAAADVSDPVLLEGPSDPGNAMTVVIINEVKETVVMPNYTGIEMNLSEV
jgi:hypothetical protein